MMGNQMRLLSKPNTDCDFESGTGEIFNYTAAAMQGWRKYQEDKYVCIPEFYEDCSFFGVFDGHGGSEIAEFLKRRLHLEIQDSLQTEFDIELALHSGFLSCDASLREPAAIAELNDLIEEENKNAEEMQVERPLQYLLSDDIEPSDPGDEDYIIEEDEENSSSESEEESGESDEETAISSHEFFNQEPGYLSGSTATVAIIQQNRIYVANVGDSRCVLSRGGLAIDLSLDHKPNDPEERARIIGAGGTISHDGRVNSCLNLSRAFGDFKFKGKSLEPSRQCITAEPFIKSIDIERNDDFLIIASDGIWNSMSSQEVVDFIEVRLKDQNSHLEDVCEEMFRLIIAADTNNDGSGCDNMCCIIIKFNKDDDSSIIYKACVSNKVMSSYGSLKQKGKNVRARPSGSADQSTPEKTSVVEEKSIHQKSWNSHLIVQFIKPYMQNLVNLRWIDFSLREGKNANLTARLLVFIDEVTKKFVNHVSCIKKIAPHFLKNDMQCSVCSLKQEEILESPETVVSPICEDKMTYEKGKGPKTPVKSDNLRITSSTSSCIEQIVHNLKNSQLKEVFLGFLINDIVNLADSNLQNTTRTY